MQVLLITFHVLTCLALILIVLLQHGKGADIGVQFGAGQTVFGARGAGNFLTKLTTGAAIVFMGTSLILSKLSARADVSDILAPAGVERPFAPEAPASEVQAEPIEGAGDGGLQGFEQIEPPAAQPAREAPAPPANP